MSEVLSVQNHLNKIENQVASLKSALTYLIDRLERNHIEVDNPFPEGTTEWWEWAERQADKDIQAGRGIELRTQEDIDRYFDTL